MQDLTEAGIDAWVKAIALYPSQISSFWSSLDDMHKKVRHYASLPIGHTLWYTKD